MKGVNCVEFKRVCVYEIMFISDGIKDSSLSHRGLDDFLLNGGGIIVMFLLKKCRVDVIRNYLMLTLDS